MSVEVNRIFPYFNDSHWRLFRKGKNAALIYIFLNKEIYEFETITERIASEQVQNHTKAMEKKTSKLVLPPEKKIHQTQLFRFSMVAFVLWKKYRALLWVYWFIC